MKKSCTLFFIVFLLSSVAFSQTGEWNVSGHIQLRSELDGRDFIHDTHPLTFTSLRTRVGVGKNIGTIAFYAQIQDSRVFGEEKSTLASIRNLDLHQGYVTLKDPFNIPLSLQAGRFEMVYGTERFFGAVGWHYVGRAWDGVRLRLRSGFNLDLFALTQVENQTYIGNATPAVYPNPHVQVPSSSVYGFWSSFMLGGKSQLDPFFYYDINRTKLNGEDPALSRYTAGINYFYKHPVLSSIFEGAYQWGDEMTNELSAYLLSLQLTYNISNWKFTGGADILSGTLSDDGILRTFDPAYGTNHKFYGFMDYFIGIPVNTVIRPTHKSVGLHDFYLMAGLQPQGSRFTANVWFHNFSSNQKFLDESMFGQEVDVTLSYNFVKGTSLSWGGSVFIPGELMKLRFNGEDPAFWSYVMISAEI